MIDSDLTRWARGDMKARFALAHICDPADTQVLRHCHAHGSESTLVQLVSGRIPQRSREVYSLRWSRCDLDQEWSRAQQIGARVLTPVDAEWPGYLDDKVIAPPYALWVVGSGRLADLVETSVAVVGARACTHYGADVARSWSADIASSNVTVVSGGAFGIDIAAHSGALAADRGTVVVTAGGVDVAYPRAHHGLFQAAQRRGCVVSETPLGSSVRRARFLTRNRLIAALTRGTVVVEAARRSGSLNTARYAHDFGRLVMAVPGPVTSGMSAGCHEWIADRRAELVLSPGDVLGLITGVLVREHRPSGSGLPAHLGLLLDAWPTRPDVSIDDLVVASGWTRDRVEQAVEELAAMAAVIAGEGCWSRPPR